MTLGDVFCCTFCEIVPVTGTPSGIGFAPRAVAAFRSASRSWPPRRASSRAALSVIQAFIASAG
jgi:hypothetical protein